jgi:CubicO group peptidase (beta-lactamase class C family)
MRAPVRIVVASWLLLACVSLSAAEDRSAAQLQRIRQAAVDSHSDALLLVHDGRILLDSSQQAVPSRIELMSATKSVVALGIGLLIADGRLASIDVPVHQFFPEWAQGRKREITVRMLLDHTSGLQNDPNAGVEIEPAPDIVQLALAAELDAAPGSTFSYNKKASSPGQAASRWTSTWTVVSSGLSASWQAPGGRILPAIRGAWPACR